MFFSKKDYYQEKFIKAFLNNENVKDVEFEDCNFIDSKFVDSQFMRCKFINCEFDNCLVSTTNFSECKFIDVDFLNSKVIGLDWTLTHTIHGISFESCQINYSNFRFLKLPKIQITKCEAVEVDFTETDLLESNFQNTNLEGSTFFKTNLSKANFQGATSYYISARENTIKGAKFSMPEALNLLSSLDVIID